jgi:hypothetical protein
MGKDYSNLKVFLILYFQKKLAVKEKTFHYYKDLFEVFLMYPHFFFDELAFCDCITKKVDIVRNEKMCEWSVKERKQMNRLLESVTDLTKVFQS